MTPPVLPLAPARRLFLHRQGLGVRPPGRLGDAALLAMVEALGFVQMDSIATVERAHHMILSARSPAYRPAQLARLLERDRALFEHWTHDAAAIPTRFFPHWRGRFARDAQRLAERWPRWQGDGCLAAVDAVLARVREEGPLSARAFGDDRPRKGAGWWDWSPEKTALEYAWRTGRLAVARREGFVKVFDLVERVLPGAAAAPAPDPRETADWACAAALDRLGFATSGEIAAFWGLVTPEETAAWARARLAEGALVEIAVETADGRPRRCLARPDVLAEAEAAPEPPRRIRVLSPFDPALRDRARTERLFGFRYRIEVFTPEAKRRFGYYVLPLLEGDRLVGRIDMRARRETGTLEVRALWPEPGAAFGPRRLARLDAELDRVARFAGCDRVVCAEGWLRAPA